SSCRADRLVCSGRSLESRHAALLGSAPRRSPGRCGAHCQRAGNRDSRRRSAPTLSISFYIELRDPIIGRETDFDAERASAVSSDVRVDPIIAHLTTVDEVETRWRLQRTQQFLILFDLRFEPPADVRQVLRRKRALTSGPEQRTHTLGDSRLAVANRCRRLQLRKLRIDNRGY